MVQTHGAFESFPGRPLRGKGARCRRREQRCAGYHFGYYKDIEYKERKTSRSEGII